MEKNGLALNEVIDNLFDCLQRAQERIKELGEVSPDLPYVTEDMTLVDDIEKSLEDCNGLFRYINSAMVFASYAGEKSVSMAKEGKSDPFEFGPDGFDMREKYWEWATEIGADVWNKEEYYDVLKDFFEEKVNEQKVSLEEKLQAASKACSEAKSQEKIMSNIQVNKLTK